MNLKVTQQVVADYQKLFVNRRAYTMQSLRPHSNTGRHYYFRPNKKGTDVLAILTDQTIRRHLEGEITVGLYAINPSTQRCKWVAIDADYRNAMEDLLKLQYHLSQDTVASALEMSKRGGHLLIFRHRRSWPVSAESTYTVWRGRWECRWPGRRHRSLSQT